MKKPLHRKLSPRVALLIESSRSYGRDLLLGIAKYVRVHGPWSIEFEEGDPGGELPEWIARWKWDGIIARISSPEMEDALGRFKVPIVDLSGTLPEVRFPRLRSDENLVGRMAADHLIDCGFKRFAFCGYQNADWSELRRIGFEQRIAEAGFSCRVFNDGGLERWLESLPKPCGMMACNDSRGRQVLNGCRELGIAVPDEVAVIGVDKDEIFCELSDLPLSSVILNAQQIGYEAAALLTRLMAGESANMQANVIKPAGVAARRSTDVLAMEDRHVAAALRHIREHACEGLDVAQILDAVPLSRSVLERRFAQILGSSPKAEILRVRLDRVCRLLTESDLSLAEVAEKAGFENPEYMSRLFKKKLDITPGDYRKQATAAGSGMR